MKDKRLCCESIMKSSPGIRNVVSDPVDLETGLALSIGCVSIRNTKYAD
jgi:hypothetical protein